MSDYPYFQRILEDRGYTYVYPIGDGAQGKVFGAKNASGMDVAVKVYDDKRRAKREIDAAVKTAGSPYIVSLLQDFDHEGFSYLVLQRGEETLRDFMVRQQAQGKGVLSRGDCYQLLLGVAHGIEYFHRVHGAHCDIKPENLLIFDGHFVKICDLGGACFQETSTDRVTNRTKFYTKGYAPPGHDGSPKPEVDTYALAVIWAELRLGRHPFESPNGAENSNSQIPHLEGLDADEKEALSKAFSDPATIESPNVLLETLNRTPKKQVASAKASLRDIDEVPARLARKKKKRKKVDKPKSGFTKKEALAIRRAYFLDGSLEAPLTAPEVCEKAKLAPSRAAKVQLYLDNVWSCAGMAHKKGEEAEREQRRRWQDAVNATKKSMERQEEAEARKKKPNAKSAASAPAPEILVQQNWTLIIVGAISALVIGLTIGFCF